MKAAVLVTQGRFELRNVPRPAHGPDDVLIRVARCGICGTDVHMFRGHYAADKLPLIPGHEFAGTVAAVGSSVTRFAVGDPVVADINVGCGHCRYCRRNEVLNCPGFQQIGITCDGGFAEFVAVPSRLVIAAPASAAMEVLAHTGGRGADIVVESVGLARLYQLAFDLIRPGGHVAAFGLTGADATVPLRLLQTVLRENSVKGSVAAMGEDVHDALAPLVHGRFRLGDFTAKSYPFDDVQDAFEGLPASPDVLKVQIAV